MLNKFKKKLINSKVAFKGAFLKIIQDVIELPNKKESIHEYVDHPGGVAIIAINSNSQFILEKQYRHALGEIILEFPAGKLESGEDALTTAKRELQEETGFSAKNWVYLGECLPCIGYSNEKIVFYLATDITSGKQNLEDGELLEIETLNFEECLQLAYNGKITDSKTLSGLLLYQGYLINNSPFST